MDIVHVCPPPDGSIWAIGVVIVLLLVSGMPIAPIGLLLSASTRRRNYRWPSSWQRVFRAAFVVQLSSLVVTAPFWFAFVLSTFLGADGWDSVAAMVFSASVIAGCFALVAWHRLIAAVQPDVPLSIRE